MTMSGLWPPSSSWTRLPWAVAFSRTPTPTGTDPVNETALTSGACTSGSPAAEPRPMTMLSTPFGSPASLEGSRQVQSREGRVLGELHHHRVAIGQGGRRLPRGNRDGEVPRGDEPDHPHRAAAGVDDRPGGGLLEQLPHGPQPFAREEAQYRGRPAGLATGLAQRLAHLPGHVASDLLGASLDGVGGLAQVRPPGGSRQAGPGAGGIGGRGHASRDVIAVRAGELPDGLGRPPRVAALIDRAAAARSPLAGDEVGRRQAGHCV